MTVEGGRKSCSRREGRAAEKGRLLLRVIRRLPSQPAAPPWRRSDQKDGRRQPDPAGTGFGGERHLNLAGDRLADNLGSVIVVQTLTDSGVAIAASYEAKAFRIKNGTPRLIGDLAIIL